MPTFTKTPRSPRELVRELSRRGLTISNHAQAEHVIRIIGYYRLSGYTLLLETEGSVVQNSNGASFYERTHQFRPGTTFGDLHLLYELDRQVRLLLFDALEYIEVAMRNELCNYMALTYQDAHWFLNRRHFNEFFLRNKFNDFLSQVAKETAKDQLTKQNRFCAHYYAKYTKPDLPPIWMIAEQLSMGVWSRVYEGLAERHDKKNIAGCFGTSPQEFQSWVRALSYLRNLCAHHARLIGVNFVQTPRKSSKLPAALKNTDFAMFAAIVHFFMKKIDMEPSWGRFLESRLRNLSTENVQTYRILGFPNNWFDDPFWS